MTFCKSSAALVSESWLISWKCLVVIVLLTICSLLQIAYLSGRLQAPSSETIAYYLPGLSSSLAEALPDASDDDDSGKPKIILLWTGWFSDTKWESHFKELGGSTIYTGTVNKTCTLTSDRGLLEDASAIIFHGRNFDFNDLPKERTPKQRWAFFLMESPRHSYLDWNAWSGINNIGFNWTMFYTTASDSPYPYGRVNQVDLSEHELEEIDEKITDFAANFSSRPSDGVWIVSHCSTYSRREDIVTQLVDAGLKIERWGGCFSQRPDSELERLGETGFYSRYRFYFGLENSLCTDYATEKFFNAALFSQRYGTIPVLLGGANYSQLLEPGAFIDLREPGVSINDTIALLKNLGQPGQSDTVRKYYEWQKRKVVDSRPFAVLNWPVLCEKLWRNKTQEPWKTVENVQAAHGRCFD